VTNKYPRLRTHSRKGKGGQVWTYWTYDQRPHGPEISLGNDYPKALEKWDLLHNKKPLTVGKVQEAINRWRDECLPKYTNADTRKSYGKQLSNIEPVFGSASWHQITLPILRQYLDKRTAKIQGNRELSVLSIVWGKARIWGMTELQWPATGVKSWKNTENAREVDYTDALYAAIYNQADGVLKDAMDIATATGMRLGDVRSVRMPHDGQLHFRAGKTGKKSYFDVSKSPILTELLARRNQVDSVMLLCTSTGRQVSYSMLRARYEEARDKAALANPVMSNQIRALYLRDCRKRAADLAQDLNAASELLQHSSKKMTADHYRQKATELKAVR
jgi:integrase